MGTDLNSFKIDFGALNGNEGDIDLTLVYSDGTSESLSGDYETNADCSEIELQIDGDNVEFDFEIDGDELVLDGIVDGYALRWEFERD